MNDLVTSPEDPTVKYKEDAHCTRSTSFKIVCVSKLAIHDRNRFEGAVNYLIAQQKHTRSKQTQEARLAQLVKGWIHTHTTQVQVLVEALGAYFLLNGMPHLVPPRLV